jgi:hypothetical protein
MSALIISVVFLAAAVALGAVVTRVLASMPLSVLACAENDGRYARLGQACAAALPAGGGRARQSLPVADSCPA